MPTPARVTPEYAKEKITSGNALLVCAYDDEEKFSRVHLEGALSFSEFRAQDMKDLSKDKEVIFY